VLIYAEPSTSLNFKGLIGLADFFKEDFFKGFGKEEERYGVYLFLVSSNAILQR
jgi:hypothetical protein